MDEAPHGNNESIWWRDLKVAFQNTQQGHDFKNNILWRVGCGNNSKFWEDNWLDGEGTLLAKYPRLYIISCQQNQVIQQMGSHKDIEWKWDFRWQRTLFDSEIDMVVSFLEDVEGKTIHPQKSDQWVWTVDPSGQYSVKSIHNMLRGEIMEEI